MSYSRPRKSVSPYTKLKYVQAKGANDVLCTTPPRPFAKQQQCLRNRSNVGDTGPKLGSFLHGAWGAPEGTFDIVILNTTLTMHRTTAKKPEHGGPRPEASPHGTTTSTPISVHIP